MILKNFLSNLVRRRLKQRILPLNNISNRDIVIDCGANVGKYTVQMAKTGAKVFAFEPDPIAFKLLSKRLRNYKNVELFNSGVWISDGKIKLYFRKDRDSNELLSTQGSSIIEEKNNLSTEFIEVPVINFSEFISKNNLHITLMKMDIEGAEVEVMNHLIDTGAILNFESIFIETHERKIKSLIKSTEELKKRCKELNGVKISFDWI